MKTKKKKFIKIFIVVLSSFFSFAALSEEITVFYNKDQVINNRAVVMNNGHSLLYLQMDLIEEIQDRLSSASTENYKEELNIVIENIGRDKLMKLSDSERTQIFIDHFQGIGINLSQSAISEKDNKELDRATRILQYSFDQGVTKDMLPAILFQGNLYRNVTDFSFLFKKDDQ